MTFQNLGANFAKVAKFIDNKLDFLPVLPRKILLSAVCIIGIPFLVIAVLLLRDWSSTSDINSHAHELDEFDGCRDESLKLELGNNFVNHDDEESYQFIKDGFYSAGPEGEGFYANGFKMPENTDKDWL